MNQTEASGDEGVNGVGEAAKPGVPGLVAKDLSRLHGAGAGRNMDTKLSPARQSANGEIVAHSLGEIRSFMDELKHGSRKYRTIASLSGQIAEAYRGRCVLELLQNAHDALTAAPRGDSGQITFVLETEPAPALLVANSGRAFERRDFKALCRLGQSPKDPNRSVGNKGLGFRSVLEVASAPEIWSTGTSEGSSAFVFRFDPDVRERVADALAELEAKGLETRSPFEASEMLVDWTEDQLQRYRERLRAEGLDGPKEAMEYLSPYDLPLPIGGTSEVVDELLRDGHATVVCLPLDGGRTGDVGEAVASVRTQLENLLAVSTPLFLPRLRTLVVAIDGRRRTVRRRVEAVEAFGEVGCGRRERVGISCSEGEEETAEAARFLVWTRALGGADDPEWAARIGEAVRHLPNRWPEVDSVHVGVAVQEGEESADGRFVIFLPTEMATGTAAHVNAPFYGSLDRRRIQFEDEYNRLLLDCVVDLSLDVIGDLAAGEPEEAGGRALVDILSSDGEVGETGETMLALLRDRATARGAPLDGRMLMLCDDGWAAPTEARTMPEVAEGLAIRTPDWRRSAAFRVVAPALETRGREVETVLEGLDGSAEPTPAEWVRTVERVAQGVQSGDIDATWDGYLTTVIGVLPWNLLRINRLGAVDALTSANFLPVQDGRLISADSPARVFFQPVRGIDEEAELVDTVPDSLTQRIAFVHGDVVLTHEEGSRRRSTEVHKFLDGRFARGFRREEILREVVLAAVPPTPVAFGSEEAALCAELLGWTLGLLGGEPPEPLLGLLEGLPVACGGGWRPAREASFGAGWPGRAGEDLRRLWDELGDAGERLRATALLDPGDARWGVDVGGRADLFARIGVAKGLRLRPAERLRFEMAQDDYELPGTAPSGAPPEPWEAWRAAVHPEAEPKHVGPFNYYLEGVLDLPELHVCGHLSQGGRRVFSRLVVDSMQDWPARWEQATVRKSGGEASVWRITSPVKHWLSAMPWFSDGVGGERVLADRWLVPMSLIRGQGEQFGHLRPLPRELSRRLDGEAELLGALQRLGLNVYPTDGERIGPELLDALAEAWQTERVLPGQFDVFLGQLRHAWQHLDESRGLPAAFLVRTAHRRFEVVDSAGLAGVYLPDDAAKGRALREEDKPVLEMEVALARRLVGTLVNATPVRLASELVERDVIDRVVWDGAEESVRALEETRYSWLAAPVLAILAHGGGNPTGHATTAWADALSRLRGAGLLECGSIVVELVDGEETIAKGEPPARWLAGDVLAVTNDVGHFYEALAPAVQAMLDRQDLLKDLRLVLGALEGVEKPSREEIEKALERSEIDAQAFSDIRSRWAGNAGLVASRIRPVAALFGVAGDGFEAAMVDMDRLTEWLVANLPQWDAAALITAARRSRDDHAMGMATWRALGDVAELTTWNATLTGLGEEYEPVRNRDVQEQAKAHLEGMQALSAAVARAIAVDCGEPELFRKIEHATRAFSAPDDWSTRWWEVPFEAVVDTLCDTWREIVDSGHLAVLSGTKTPGHLRDAIEERGIAIETDPYDTMRVNTESLGRVLLEAHDLHRTWLEFHDPYSRVPDLPSAPELAADAYLRRWTGAELWCLALATLDDERFAQACAGASDLQTVRERLGLDDEAVERKRRERAEREREAARKAKTVEIAGESFEIEAIDYSALLRRHAETLEAPAGPQASKDEFTPLGPLRARGRAGGGGEKGRTGHRRLTPEEAEVVGTIGEMHAYRYLKKEFGGRSVRASAWVSESRLKVQPLVEGEKDEISDGHGFDLRFTHQGIRWHVEVKATNGDDTSFDLGISEIEAATRIARRRGNVWRWRILRVRRALSAEPVIDWLPNPFEEGFQKHYRLHRGGMVVSYARNQS